MAENGGSTDDMKKIVDQLEYYFGDYNLPRDKFFRQQTELDDGWIPLDIMLKCQRLSKLADSTDAIVKAIEELKSPLLELSEDKKKIRRDPSKPINEDHQKEILSRSVYCKGFNTSDSLEELREYFAQFGPILSIHMRTFKNKREHPPKIVFKGSLFAVFEKLETAQDFMKLESVKYKDTELIRKWQADYNEEKRLERLEKMDKGKKKNKSKGEANEEGDQPSIPAGCYLHISGDFGDTSREALRAAVQENCDVKVAFVEFNKGDKEAVIRLQGEQSAAKVVEKIEGKLKLAENVEVAVKTLTEEEEKPHREKALQFINKNRKFGGGFRRGGGKRRGGRFGRQHGGKRSKTDAGGGDGGDGD